MNFGGIAPAFTVYKKAAFVVIPVPYDLTSTYQSGSRRGPGAILDASGNMELYDEMTKKDKDYLGRPLPFRLTFRMTDVRMRLKNASRG